MMKLILKTQEHVIQKCENGSSSNDDQLKPANSAASANKAGNGNGARKSYQLDEFLSDIGIKRNFTQLKSHYHEMIRVSRAFGLRTWIVCVCI